MEEKRAKEPTIFHWAFEVYQDLLGNRICVNLEIYRRYSSLIFRGGPFGTRFKLIYRLPETEWGTKRLCIFHPWFLRVWELN